jgi:trk/ktr system potassium uptake protein
VKSKTAFLRKRFNLKMILGVLGLLLIINGLFILSCLPASFYFGEETWSAIGLSGGVSIMFGLFLRLLGLHPQSRDIRKQDGFLIVTLGWFLMSLFGMLPYISSGVIPAPIDAFFETMSGYTTTGATILTDIEAVPKSILLWRSLTHWIGGMGIIVLTIAILPILGVGGMQLFVAESPGISPDKLHPRITETAKRLWIIYVLLTLMEITLLRVNGMGLFDSVNHSMATMATGGFSTKNASIAFYQNDNIHFIITFFMFLAGANFTLLFLGFSGKFKRIWANEEFRTYTMIVLVAVVATTLSLYFYHNLPVKQAFRDGAFQVLTIVTTTGFITSDYTLWPTFVTFILFILFFVGGSAGSTAGGIKVIRHIILFKNSRLEFRRLLHPSGIIPVRFNGKAVSSGITHNIAAFVLIYLIIFFFGSLVMSALGYDFMTSMGSVIATLGNVGPGFGAVGPVDNYAALTPAAKSFLSFLMLVGRLELFTVLILFMPYFWRKK